MPELPEIETIKRILKPQLLGRTIVNLTMNRLDIIAHPLPEEFKSGLTGVCIENMGRRGKFLSISFNGGKTLLLHLRMTGQLLVTPEGFPVEKHTHIVFNLDDGNELRFIDTRRFGRIWLFENGESDTYSGIQKLGPEPFDISFYAAYLRGKLGKRGKSIKECLLDQSIVAGIGNIYGDEIMFAAGIHPSRSAKLLTPSEWEAVATAIPAVLKNSINNNCMTPEEYLQGRGKEYRNESFFKVYGREGQKCQCCSAMVERTVLAGRSSYYCPNCQGERV
jgi:formamidopyrimidine-DNA glycosylase